ncbi:glycosyltransferase family 2 protein [Agromyces sp. NPDC056379]|uniref:glycosyltransferase family 2 protein n=1 Tax=unclassified Agromyces TaxID=2639701 RepID=UPI0035D706A4
MLEPVVWSELFAGVPVAFQVLFWIALTLTVISFVSITGLAIAGFRYRRGRRRRIPEGAPGEDDFLWVFVVPALDEEVTIADSVARLLDAEAHRAVILVVDDGSTDRTGEILRGIDDPRLRVLTRTAPNARRGKAAALNEAYRHIRDELLTEPGFSGIAEDRVIVGIIDADGRLERHAPDRVAWHFADPLTAGVQVLVRIYNANRFLTWAQDVEFSSFGFVYQAGRASWGTANMGGNGQFNRLSALTSIAVDDGPWRDRLTEDQDLGVRLIQAGWRGAQENGAAIDQQGVPALRRLYRQRVRWAQGGWQALGLIGGSTRLEQGMIARIDAVHYLLTPVLISIAGLDFFATIVLAVALQVPIIPASLTVLLLFLTLGFGPGFITLFLRGRGVRGFLLALVETVPYAAYTWIVFPVFLSALVRHWTGRTSWAKTAREAIDSGLPEPVDPLTAEQVEPEGSGDIAGRAAR